MKFILLLALIFSTQAYAQDGNEHQGGSEHHKSHGHEGGEHGGGHGHEGGMHGGGHEDGKKGCCDHEHEGGMQGGGHGKESGKHGGGHGHGDGDHGQ